MSQHVPFFGLRADFMLIYLCCPLHYVFLLFSDNYRFIIQVVIVPIWKKEHWEDGEMWIGDQLETKQYPTGQPEEEDLT